jgi:hypothetical protein
MRLVRAALAAALVLGLAALPFWKYASYAEARSETVVTLSRCPEPRVSRS